MQILIAGGSGFVGKSLLPCLKAKGHTITLLARDPGNCRDLEAYCQNIVKWNTQDVSAALPYLHQGSAVINLAGAPVIVGRWTKKRKNRILKSRIDATKTLIRAVLDGPGNVHVFVNASAVGYYGDRGDDVLTEGSSCGNDFLADVCRQWEECLEPLREKGIRTICLRTGIVIASGGGALAKMMFPFRLGLGGPLGSGKQWFPWIHREDLAGAIEYCLNNHAIDGPVNAVSPGIVTMENFCRALGKALRRPSVLRVPGPILRIVLGEMSSMFLGGQRAQPNALTEAGFSFKYFDLNEALDNILKANE